MSDLISKIKLLDDPDENIYQFIRDSIISDGLDAIPLLENTWGNEHNPLVQERIEEIVKTIQFRHLKTLFLEWKQNGAKDIIYGAYLVAKYIYADLQWDSIETSINKIKTDIWIELNQNLTALEKVKLLNFIVFEVYGFNVTMINPYSPQNYFINHVLDTKKGNDLALCVLYTGIAQRLNIPIFGVNLPNNYIVCYVDQLSAFEAFGDTTDNDVLFYITPRGKGTVFGRKEIDYFLKQAKIEPKRDYYSPVSNLDFIIEMLKQLIISYSEMGYIEKSNDLNEIIHLLI